ncbi:MAG: sulfite exporter TauE/SafE family protein, partial [Beijerinckiaceae bacterium]|nr:sulfite exporter TauE/SafE family protein [Beijerinckiaceae bacterium]
KGMVDMSILKIWAVPVVLGVIVGSYIARFAPADLFKIIFVIVAIFSALRLLFASDRWQLGTEMPGRVLMTVYGGVIGVLSALMGIGGGQLSSLFMTFYGRPIHQAVATSSGLGVLISIPGALGFIYAGWPKMDVLPPLSLGYVSLIGFILFIPTSIWTAPIGARLAHRLSKRKLEVVFGLFLLIVAARFIWTLLH